VKEASRPQPQTKKPYTPPRLTKYGKFKDLVQGKGGKKGDPGGVNRSRA